MKSPLRRSALLAVTLAAFNLHCSHSKPERLQVAEPTLQGEASYFAPDTPQPAAQSSGPGHLTTKPSPKSLQTQKHPALATLELNESWELVSSESGLIVHKREVPGSSLLEVRGETIIHAPIAKVLQVLADTENKPKWVDRLVEARRLRPDSPHYLVEYNHSDAPWPVKDRDFVFQAHVEVDEAEKMVLIHLESIDEPTMPEQDCCVRGHMNKSIYALRSIGEGAQTHVALRVSVDPKGSIPKWLVNMLQESWPRDSLLALQRQVARDDVPEHPYYKAVFARIWAKGKRLATAQE